MFPLFDRFVAVECFQFIYFYKLNLVVCVKTDLNEERKEVKKGMQRKEIDGGREKNKCKVGVEGKVRKKGKDGKKKDRKEGKESRKGRYKWEEGKEKKEIIGGEE